MERRDEGRRVIRFEASGDISSLIDSIGHTPLPPYIKRDQEDLLDSERYQTVYAKRSGAVAAPTAGLHFTPDLLTRLRDRGVEIAEITLHVGYGTFQPVRASRVEEHRVEQENYFIEAEDCRQLNSALAEGRRIIAVGTTTTRALESWALGPRAEASGLETDLFIYPGFQFKVISGLITNFHLPRSSLLMLVSAFAGRENVLRAYRHAIERGYRFYSYGDAMLIR
jgi:S-adenosylmethionine:tRNA ribosyltransferase-isomerase